MSDSDLQTITDLLKLSAMALSTAGPDGLPHAAPVYFAAQGALTDVETAILQVRLIYFSAGDSRHAQDTRRAGLAAAAIYPQVGDYLTIHGLQLHGTVRELPSGPEWDAAWEVYRTKFPFTAGLRMIVEHNGLFIFSPTWARLIDNRRGFGFKRTWEAE